jgi:hypothetical protein
LFGTKKLFAHDKYYVKFLQLFFTFAIVCVTTLNKNKTVENQKNKLGFTQFAENWNGRLAMMGFIIGIATELLTGQGILSQLGLI